MSDRSFFKNAKYDKTIEITEEDLRKLKSILLDILQEVTELADRYKLRYTLGGGTCLGAVRHKGFIPWDDDIDIILNRRDYERFLKLFDKELGDKYILLAPSRGRGHGMTHTQIKLKGTVYQSFNELSKTNVDEMAIFIDVFVMENTFNSGLLRKSHGIACLAAGYILTCRKTYEDFPYLKSYIKGNKELYKGFAKKARIGSFFKFLPLDSLARVVDKVYGLCRNNKSDYVTIPSGRGHYFKETYLREDMQNRKLAKFDAIKAYIPAGYKVYLSRLYGNDYMELPPVENRESHPIMRLEFGKY